MKTISLSSTKEKNIELNNRRKANKWDVMQVKK